MRLASSCRRTSAALWGPLDAADSPRALSRDFSVSDLSEFLVTVIAFKEVGILPLLPPTEAMLSVQMIAAHEAALLFLKRATLQDQTMEGSDANVLRAPVLCACSTNKSKSCRS